MKLEDLESGDCLKELICSYWKETPQDESAAHDACEVIQRFLTATGQPKMKSIDCRKKLSTGEDGIATVAGMVLTQLVEFLLLSDNCSLQKLLSLDDNMQLFIKNSMDAVMTGGYDMFDDFLKQQTDARTPKREEFYCSQYSSPLTSYFESPIMKTKVLQRRLEEKVTFMQEEMLDMEKMSLEKDEAYQVLKNKLHQTEAKLKSVLKAMDELAQDKKDSDSIIYELTKTVERYENVIKKLQKEKLEAEVCQQFVEKTSTWVVGASDKAKYDEMFYVSDKDADGFVTWPGIKDTLLQSGVSQPVLAHIWNLCDIKQSGKLNSEQFALTMYLIHQKIQGHEVPPALLPEMIPPMMRPKPSADGIQGSSDIEHDANNTKVDVATETVNDNSGTYVPPPAPPSCTPNSADYSYNYNYSQAIARQETGFVGLVNQAMTCYLNSLLQTLYMTPEFRNALYRWEFDGTEEEGAKSIPFQLQRLFLLLQTSRRPAVGTTELTTSFGWDSSEAWQQHDVQELCRVMFDALEQKFKNTDQSDLISKHYEGKLKDYVKCLQCEYESAREDTFLVIPLVVRPCLSSQAYASVEEALHAFVTPEILDGCNQYFCESCSKKCDAHKGLRFIKFPYLLTLQLKRSDFDPVTMNRMKLNNKVTFPEILNLNEFVQAEVNEGPYIYELFSIMVHSGSANGGHYYAYIKSFQDGGWYCFNDAQVTRISYDDIQKTYGGGTSRGYYSSTYSSSTNAYMLMFRQIDREKNAQSMDSAEFPEHIKVLLQYMQEQEEKHKQQKELDRNMCKIKLFGPHPTQKRLIEHGLKVHKDDTLAEATATAQKLLGYDGLVALDCCRLVKYDDFHDSLDCSFENSDDVPMGQLLDGVKSSYSFDLLFEIKKPHEKFEVYKPEDTYNAKSIKEELEEADRKANPVPVPFVLSLLAVAVIIAVVLSRRQ